MRNLLVLLVLGGIAWWGYTNWIESAADPEPRELDTGFNCRTAIAEMSKKYECRNSPTCTLTTEEDRELKELEINIQRYCN